MIHQHHATCTTTCTTQAGIQRGNTITTSHYTNKTDLGHVLSLALGGVLPLLGQVASLHQESQQPYTCKKRAKAQHLQSLAVLGGADLGGLKRREGKGKAGGEGGGAKENGRNSETRTKTEITQK